MWFALIAACNAEGEVDLTDAGLLAPGPDPIELPVTIDPSLTISRSTFDGPGTAEVCASAGIAFVVTFGVPAADGSVSRARVQADPGSPACVEYATPADYPIADRDVALTADFEAAGATASRTLAIHLDGRGFVGVYTGTVAGRTTTVVRVGDRVATDSQRVDVAGTIEILGDNRVVVQTTSGSFSETTGGACGSTTITRTARLSGGRVTDGKLVIDLAFGPPVGQTNSCIPDSIDGPLPGVPNIGTSRVHWKADGSSGAGTENTVELHVDFVER
jgi:hypothetical protein